MNLQLLPTDLLNAYMPQVPEGLGDAFQGLQEAPISTTNFSFYTSVASVYSSKIEGETVELDSYIKHKRDGIAFQPDYTKKIDDLYNAYVFAQSHSLNEANVKLAHQILSQHLLAEAWQGKYRNQHMYVATDEGKIEYVAAMAGIVPSEMALFFEDVKNLLNAELSIEAVFYFASMIHLVFAKIHPWNDGNGRTARLIEKWFLAEKLGPKAWFLQSEKMYYLQHDRYYKNLRLLGLEYDQLKYGNALPFTLMLPTSLPGPVA